MNRRTVVVILVGCIVAGCQSNDGTAERYHLEQALWQAQVQERKININFLQASQSDLEAAISSFESILADSSMTNQQAQAWSPAVHNDIERIRVVSKIALANLYFLTNRYNAAGELYDRTLATYKLPLENRVDIRLNLTRSWMMSGDEVLLQEASRRLFDEVSGSSEFWSGSGQIDDAFLNIPLMLAESYLRSGDESQADTIRRRASAFYDRVANTWPETVTGANALYWKAQLRMAEGEWDEAVAIFNRLIAHPAVDDPTGTFRLMKAEAIYFGLADKPRGRDALTAVRDIDPTTPVGLAAEFNLAIDAIAQGNRESGLSRLSAIEAADRVDVEMIARSMLTRAIVHEEMDRWDRALPILQRLMRVYPSTAAAANAPLRITQHYVESGDTQAAQRQLRRTEEFYLSLLERQSKFRGDRGLIEDLLLENFILAGRARDGAALLEEKAGEWDDDTSASGMLKSFLVYSEVLGDSDNAKRILKKCIELFPETRYAKVAEEQLEALEGGS